MAGKDCHEKRRDFMKRMGITGVSLGSIAVAGCLGDDDDDVERDVGEDLPDERRIDQTLEILAFPEDYGPDRYSSNQLIADRVSEALGADIGLEVYAGDYTARDTQGDWDMTRYAWYSEQGGDPDMVLTIRYHTNGERNFGNWSNDEYDEISEAQQRELDRDERQELVYDAQDKLSELRWEAPILATEFPYPYNTNIVDEDSVVIEPRRLATWNTWCNIEPGPENDDGVVITNDWGGPERLNAMHNEAMGPAANLGPIKLIYDSLIRYDTDYEQQLFVADELEAVDDTTIRATIDDGHTFHDGEPLTIDDVLFTFELILETEAVAYQSEIVDRVESVEQTGDDEITFHLYEPYAPFMNSSLWLVPILPEHYWEELMSDHDAEDAPWEIPFDDDVPPIGSGPFQYEAWSYGEYLEMSAHEDHPIAAPHIDTRIQRDLDSPAAEMAGLEQGEFGIFDFWFGDNDQLLSTVDEHDFLEVEVVSDNTREAVWFHQDVEPLDDVAFRQAYSAIVAATQPEIINEIYGMGERVHTPIVPSVEFWHNPDVEYVFEGEDQAIEILTDAGYQWDEDGNLYAPEDS